MLYETPYGILRSVTLTSATLQNSNTCLYTTGPGLCSTSFILLASTKQFETCMRFSRMAVLQLDADLVE